MATFVAHFFASLVVVARNCLWLLSSPYKTMRSIAKEKDVTHVGAIFLVVYTYFLFASVVRERTLHPLVISTSSSVSFFTFLITFFLATIFFYTAGKKIGTRSLSLKSLMMTSAYSLAPTFFWFLGASLLYIFIPPPRTASGLGVLFSLIFILFSFSLLFFRIVLLYLTLRFTLKTSFYTTLLIMVGFVTWFLPYSYMLYRLQIFRIPFI